MNCGLLGEKLGHSYSPQIHKQLGAYSYSLFEKSADQLEDFLKNGDFHGLNVTIPYKKAVIPYCAELSPQAKRLGAVNTIVRRADGSLVGHNTDYFGFRSMAERTGISFTGKKVLVLGSGGASNTVCAVMKELGANVVVISRKGDNNYENIGIHRDCSVIVNATPVGMYPNTGVSPVNLYMFPKLEGVLDLVYNPAKTKLLLDAEYRNLKTENGLWMLVAQAKESAQWFTGQEIPDDVIPNIHRLLKNQMENVILIGMPGCGKSTVGRLLAEKTGKTFVDADKCIEEAAGCTIPDIFAAQGEKGFRKTETQVLSELGKKTGLVIATGGGCVTRPENEPLLQQNGTVIWIERSIDALPVDGRPLSQINNLADMYRIRKPMYQHFAQYTVSNDETPQKTANAIMRILNLEESI